MPNVISFDVSKEDAAIIKSIVDRALKEQPKFRWPLDLTMDLQAAHSNGHPLRLKEFLEADGFNFWHDIGGIANCLNRDDATHHQMPYHRFFRPRFSA